MAILLVLAAFFLLCLQGYSTMALVCTAAAGVIGFYAFVPKLFKKSKAVIRLLTILLVVFLIVFAVTEGVIISASFGSPETAYYELCFILANISFVTSFVFVKFIS